MRQMVGSVLVLLLAAVVAGADETKEKNQADKPGTPAEQFKALTKEWDKVTELRQKFVEAKTEEDKQKIRNQAQEIMQKVPGQALELAEKNAKDPVAGEALAWVLMRVRSDEMLNRVLAALEKDHLDSPHIGMACERLEQMQTPGAEKFLRAVIAKSKNKDAVGLATYGLAGSLQSKAEDEADKTKAEQLRKEAEKLYEQVISKYGDVKGSEGPIGPAAKAAISLAVGKDVPDITGEDADGKKFKLSDYRGKVVLLDFWGHW